MKIEPFCYTPSSFVDYVREAVPELQKLTWNQSFVYLSLIWGNTGSNKRYQHAANDDSFSITAKLLVERLGRDYRDIFDEIKLIDIIEEYDPKKGQTKPYKVTEQAKQLVENYVLHDQNQTELLGPNKKPYALATKNKQPNAIKARDKNGNNAKCRLNINPVVKVDLWALDALKNALIYQKDRLFHSIEPKAANDAYMCLESTINDCPVEKLERWLETRIIAILQLTHIATANIRLPAGQIIQSYCESNSGRLYGQDIHLQTLPKLVRTAALNGQYDYDLENCHYTILSQIAARYGIKTHCIDGYLINKKQTRDKLAMSINVEPTKIKECLLALIYGASISIKPNTALSELLDIEKLTRLNRNKTFIGLHRDIKAARNAVIDNHKQRASVLNAMGKRLDLKKGKPALLAHILQGYEAKMLNIAIQMYGDEITLLQHDGFTSPNPNLNTGKIETKILEETGLKMSISKSVLKTLRMHSNENPTGHAA